MIDQLRKLNFILLISSFIFYCACCTKPPITDTDAMLPPALEPFSPPLPADELVARYNANLAPIQRLWARSEVSLTFLDADGKPRFERGEGNLIFARPSDLALTLGKLNQTILWAGSDADRYWFFDLSGDGVAYVGRHDRVGQVDTKRLPLPIYPGEVPYLLGLEPIDTAVLLGEDRGYVILQPVGTNLRIMVNPRSGRPARIDVIGREGQPVLVSRLYDYQPIETDSLSEADWPKAAARVDLYALDAEANIELKLMDMTDGVSRNRIKPRAFDFDALAAALHPSRVIDLDASDKPSTDD